MSIDDMYANSEARRIREARDKIRVSLWPEQSIVEPLWCYVCRKKLFLVEDGRAAECRECGKKKPIADIKHEKKLTSRFANFRTANPLILSQKDKSKRRTFIEGDSVNSYLSDEDLNDLRNMGYNV